MYGSAAGSLSRRQHLQARRSVEAKQVGEVVIDRVQPERRVGEHRKERDDPGAGEHRRLLRQPHQQSGAIATIGVTCRITA